MEYFLPLVRELHNITTKQDQTPLAKELQNRVSLFTEKIFDFYASRCVGPKPRPPVDQPDAVKSWEEHRNVAQNEFDKVVGDEEMRKCMKARLGQSSENGMKKFYFTLYPNH